MLLGSTKNPDGARSEYDNGAAEWKSPSVRQFAGSGLLLRVRADGWSGPWAVTPAFRGMQS